MTRFYPLGRGPERRRYVCCVASTLALCSSAMLPLASATAQGVGNPSPTTQNASAQAEANARRDAQAMLASALSRIASNGRDSSALLDAGRAALTLNDPRAAVGFLARASELAPNDGFIKAATGSALVQMENPAEALRLFDQARALGVNERIYLADRGLAYDLLGDQKRAQRDYELSLSMTPSAETSRRYALSLGISGDLDRAVEVLTPLLRSQDRAAWRTRAFVVAMNGRHSEAKEIVEATMPRNLAVSITPFLTNMDRLTPPQQAAAAHFGTFPSGPLGPARTPRPVVVAAVQPPAAQAVRPKSRSEQRAEARRLAADRKKAERQAALRPGRTPIAPPVVAAAASTSAGAARATSPAQTIRTVAMASPAQPAQRVPALPMPPSVREAAPVPPVSSATGALPGLVTPGGADDRRALPRLIPVDASPAAASPVATPPTGLIPAQLAVASGIQPTTPSPSATSTMPAPAAEIAARGGADTASAPGFSALTTAPAAPTVTTPIASAAPAPLIGPVDPAPSSVRVPDVAAMGLPATEAQPGDASGDVAGGSAPDAVAAAAPADDARPLAAFSLADIAGSIAIPAEELAGPSDALDAAALDRLRTEKRRADAAAAAAREKEEAVAKAKQAAEAKAKAEADEKMKQPSRIWVQIATGANAGALASDYGKMARKAPDVFKGQAGWTAEWGRTRRLVVGPFKDMKAAQAWLNAHKKAGGDGFAWTSDAGETVTKIGAK